MAHPQSSPRGFFAKQRIDVGGAEITADSSDNILLSAGLALSGEATDVITQNSTALILAGALQVNAARDVGGNSTGYLFTAETGLPATDGGDYKWTFVVNSTGIAGIAVNTTGTTWKYCRMTSDINTT